MDCGHCASSPGTYSILASDGDPYDRSNGLAIRQAPAMADSTLAGSHLAAPRPTPLTRLGGRERDAVAPGGTLCRHLRGYPSGALTTLAQWKGSPFGSVPWLATS